MNYEKWFLGHCGWSKRPKFSIKWSNCAKKKSILVSYGMNSVLFSLSKHPVSSSKNGNSNKRDFLLLWWIKSWNSINKVHRQYNYIYTSCSCLHHLMCLEESAWNYFYKPKMHRQQRGGIMSIVQAPVMDLRQYWWCTKKIHWLLSNLNSHIISIRGCCTNSDIVNC